MANPGYPRREKDFLAHKAADGEMTDKQFSEIAGVSPKTVEAWAAKPDFKKAEERLRRAVEERTDESVFAYILRIRALERYGKSAESGKLSDIEQAKADRRLLEMTDGMEDPGMTVDFSGHDDAQLVAAFDAIDDPNITNLIPEFEEIAKRFGKRPDAMTAYLQFKSTYLHDVVKAARLTSEEIPLVLHELLALFQKIHDIRGGTDALRDADESGGREGGEVCSEPDGQEEHDEEEGHQDMQGKRPQGQGKKQRPKVAWAVKAKRCRTMFENDQWDKRTAYAVAFQVKKDTVTDDMLKEVFGD
jgi:hypothetical protein